MAEPSGLSTEQLGALAVLRPVNALSRFYLAGGSAIASHLAHRRSLDLDLFSRDADADLGELGSQLVALFASAEVVAASEAALTLRYGDLAIDIVRYPYPLLEEPTPGPEGFLTAGLRDLAAMKLSAIAKRGIKRDFWDLHEIVTNSRIDLDQSFDAYLEKFGVRQSDLYHVLRSLTYFEDAEAEQVFPSGLTLTHWELIKAYFRRNAPLRLR